MIDISRRQVVGGLATGAVALLAGSAPIAARQTRLDADVRVLEAATDFTGDIGELVVAITNTRPPDGNPFVPVPHVWGVGRQTQMAWPPARGEYPSVAPGGRVQLRLEAPGTAESVRLKEEHRAMVRVFAKGTEQRADTAFVPKKL